MASLKASLFILLLKLLKRKASLTDAESITATIAKRRQTQTHEPNEKVRGRLDVDLRNVGGFPVYIVKTKGAEAPKNHVFYLHGGAYVFELIPPHWTFVADMAAMLDACIMMPIYPLAPEHTAPEVLTMTAEAYSMFEDYVGGAAISVMGDSAGAGIGVALARKLFEAGKKLPRELVLITPFLDVILDDPAIAAIDRADPWLAPGGLREAGRLYAGDLPLDHPIVSPLRGSVEGLPPTHIFAGTRDILMPDAKAFADKINAAGGFASYSQYEGMFHCWPLIDARESMAARAEIKAIFDAT